VLQFDRPFDTAPGDFSDALNGLRAGPACTTPAVKTNFNPRIQPARP
jgi:hypothetical protein